MVCLYPTLPLLVNCSTGAVWFGLRLGTRLLLKLHDCPVAPGLDAQPTGRRQLVQQLVRSRYRCAQRLRNIPLTALEAPAAGLHEIDDVRSQRLAPGTCRPSAARFPARRWGRRGGRPVIVASGYRSRSRGQCWRAGCIGRVRYDRSAVGRWRGFRLHRRCRRARRATDYERERRTELEEQHRDKGQPR
jgi:hypothetical protein